MSDYLDQIGQRIEAATEGPWSVYRTRVGTYVTRPDLLGVAREWSLVWQDADAEFIANARVDVPRLLAAVRAVEEAMDDLDDARAQGLVLTYGAIQYRVRHALADALEGER